MLGPLNGAKKPNLRPTWGQKYKIVNFETSSAIEVSNSGYVKFPARLFAKKHGENSYTLLEDFSKADVVFGDNVSDEGGVHDDHYILIFAR